jgi:polysaccharide deacetylase 2 family uncharacterized protein YibQ
MARGFLAGVVWGTVVCGVGAGALSVAVGLPEQARQALAPLEGSDIVQSSAPKAPETVQQTPELGAVQQVPMPDIVREVPDSVPDTPLPEAAPNAETALAQPEVTQQVAVEAAQTPEIALQSPDSVQETPVAPQRSNLPKAQSENLPPQPEEDSGEAPPRIALLGQSGTPGQGSSSLLDKDSGAKSSRLPSIGSAPAEETPAESAPMGALDRYAAEIYGSVDADAPRMSVILLDDGLGALGPDAISALPFPISFAIAPNHPNPQEASAAYRKQGFEVLAMVDLPNGARPADVEVTLSATLRNLPEVIGVIEANGAPLQDSKALSDQVASYLGQGGHGLVSQDKGLNTATKLAVKSGVPAIALFRDLTANKGENQDTRRILENAAFRAKSEADVAVLGPLNGDMISALFLWGLQDRSDQLALVPVSNLLKRSVN